MFLAINVMYTDTILTLRRPHLFNHFSHPIPRERNMAGKLNRKISFLNVTKSNVSEFVAFAQVC